MTRNDAIYVIPRFKGARSEWRSLEKIRVVVHASASAQAEELHASLRISTTITLVNDDDGGSNSCGRTSMPATGS